MTGGIMKLIDALPTTDDGTIALPVAAVTPTGSELPGETTAAWVQANFAAWSDLTVPLEEEAFNALMEASTPLWQLNWQRWRDEGIL